MISLPKGSGAIRGIGEKFAANPITGTGSVIVSIATGLGRSGFAPQLSLSYDSGAGNGPFGLGWSLSLPSITRKTDKGESAEACHEAPSHISHLESTCRLSSKGNPGGKTGPSTNKSLTRKPPSSSKCWNLATVSRRTASFEGQSPPGRLIRSRRWVM